MQQPGDDVGELERSRFVEQFALLLNDAGLQRMPARVFAYVLASDAETHSAADLAAGLRVSAAAISGAVRLLIDVGMLVKDRLPGDRVDHYRLHDDDIWASIVGRQEPMFADIDVVFAAGLRALPPGAGRQRIHETREFYRFLHGQLDTLAARWRERRAATASGITTAPEPARVAPGE